MMIRDESAIGDSQRFQTAWPRTCRGAVSLALSYRIFLTLAMAWWTLVVPTADVSVAEHYFHRMERQEGLLGSLFVKYDSYWYLNIARDGYQRQAEGDNNLAFLPAYPTLIALLGKAGIPGTLAGVGVSHLCLLVAWIFAYRYAAAVAEPRTAAALLCFLAVFPSSWVWQMVYTEALFCAVLFGLLDCYHRRHYAWSALFCLTLPFIRGVGLAAVAAVWADIVWQGANNRKRLGEVRADLWRRAGVGLAGLAGVVLLGILYARISGHFFGFLRASGGWSTMAGTEGMLIPLLGTFQQGLGDPEGRLYLSFFVLYAVAVLGVILVRRDLGTWFCLAYGVMLLGTSYTSFLRFLLPLLPAHLLLISGLLGKGWFPYVLPVLAVLQVIVTRLYLDWQLVT